MERRRTRISSQNPLRIPEVLQKVLTELSLNDLKSARLVNNFWKNAAQTLMRKKCGEIDIMLTPTFSNFEQLFEDTAAGWKSIPCAKFGVTTGTDASTSQGDDIVSGREKAMIRKVFGNIGSQMRELSLNYEDNWRSWFDATDLPEGLEFPSLQVLNMKFRLFTENSKFMSKIKKDSVLVAISNILEAAPSLNKVTLSSSSSDETPTELFIGALSLVQGRKKLTFTCLEITTTTETTTWIKLASLGLRLKSLIVHFRLPSATHTRDVNFNGFTRFLETQNKSLENLLISTTFIEATLQKPTLEIPKLSKLRVLEIIDDEGNCTVSVNYNLSYANLPALKHLKIQCPWYNGVISCRREPSNSVEALTIVSASAIVFDAAVIFPNLKRLEIRADGKIGSAVCDSMPNLEELVIDTTGVPCIDNMITGRAWTCKYWDLEARRMMKGWSKKFDDSILPIGTMSEDFSRLQGLKTLRLFSKDPEQDLEITQLSICLVLLKLKSLRVLDLGYRKNSPEVFLPKRVWKELQKKCDVFWKR